MSKRQKEIKQKIIKDIIELEHTITNNQKILKNKLNNKKLLKKEIQGTKADITINTEKLTLLEAQLEDINNNEKCLWIRVTEDQHNIGADGICDNRIKYGNFKDFSYCPYCGRKLVIKHWRDDD